MPLTGASRASRRSASSGGGRDTGRTLCAALEEIAYLDEQLLLARWRGRLGDRGRRLPFQAVHHLDDEEQDPGHDEKIDEKRQEVAVGDGRAGQFGLRQG